MNEVLKAHRHRKRPDDGALSAAPRRSTRKWPTWLVSDAFDRQMAGCKEPRVRRYPGWLCVLVVVGVSAGLWWLIIKGMAALIGAVR